MHISNLLVVAVLLLSIQAGGAGAADILGAWHPEQYVLEDGTELDVSGLIFFSKRDWTVLFFVEDGNGEPVRGSGEGGTYLLVGDTLTFTHFYHLSAGDEIGPIAASPLRMSVKEIQDAAEEPCRAEVGEEMMTIHFPSGNRMVFRKSSGY